jgi:hypothetical protein
MRQCAQGETGKFADFSTAICAPPLEGGSGRGLAKLLEAVRYIWRCENAEAAALPMRRTPSNARPGADVRPHAGPRRFVCVLVCSFACLCVCFFGWLVGWCAPLKDRAHAVAERRLGQRVPDGVVEVQPAESTPSTPYCREHSEVRTSTDPAAHPGRIRLGL